MEIIDPHTYKEIFKFNFNERIIFDDRINIKKDSKEFRMCRFCGNINRRFYKKEAHAIPHSIGNYFIFSNNECDKCNSTFGEKIESQLSNYLIAKRSLFGITGKKNKIIYNNKEDGSILNIETSKNRASMIIRATPDMVLIDESDESVTFKTVSYPYTPFMVYLSFVKIFISTLPIEYYSRNIDILSMFNSCIKSKKTTEDIIKQLYLQKFASLFVTFLPGPPDNNLSILYRKDINNAPRFILLIRISNLVFQVPIPEYNIEFFNMYSMFGDDIDSYLGKISTWTEDFSSLVKCRNNQSITFCCEKIIRMPPNQPGVAP